MNKKIFTPIFGWFAQIFGWKEREDENPKERTNISLKLGSTSFYIISDVIELTMEEAYYICKIVFDEKPDWNHPRAGNTIARRISEEDKTGRIQYATVDGGNDGTSWKIFVSDSYMD
jgi:hypothetical protein